MLTRMMEVQSEDGLSVMCDICSHSGEQAGVGGRALKESCGWTLVCETCWNEFTCRPDGQRVINNVHRAISLNSRIGVDPSHCKHAFSSDYWFVDNAVQFMQHHCMPASFVEGRRDPDTNRFRMEVTRFQSKRDILRQQQEAKSPGSSTTPQITVCDWCRERADAAQFKLCDGCRLARFCSKECQRRAWPKHLHTCRIYAYPYEPRLAAQCQPLQSSVSCAKPKHTDAEQ